MEHLTFTGLSVTAVFVTVSNCFRAYSTRKAIEPADSSELANSTD